MAASADEIEIRPLRPEDDRSDFRCGEPDLDRFFEHYAGQSQFKLRLTVTYVATVGEKIVGFATVTGATLDRAAFPSAKLRKRLPAYPVPVLRLARLGVDLRAQGQGVGQALAAHVLGLALHQREAIGCLGVVVDAKPASVGFYARLGFVDLDVPREGQLVGDPRPMFLSIETLSRAVGR
ncbi:MAG: GNAT family N-acetyltransferase [Sandaracinus sp.]